MSLLNGDFIRGRAGFALFLWAPCQIQGWSGNRNLMELWRVAKEDDSSCLYGFEGKSLRKGPGEMCHLCGCWHMSSLTLSHKALEMPMWSVPNCVCIFTPL